VVRFALTEQLVAEAKAFELRSACRDCLYWREAKRECLHGWPDEGQRRWPIDAPDADGAAPAEVAFCKEFELR
jgi:hypothetical protein